MSKPRTLPTESLSLHPQAGLVPEMPADQYKLFLADVKDRGILQPIELIPGTRTVVEGRTRLKAATDAGLPAVPVVDADLKGDTPVMYMLRAALLRRQLTKGQAAALAVEIKQQLAAEAKERQREGGKKGGQTAGRGRPKGADSAGSTGATTKPKATQARDQAAAIAGTNGRYVSDAERVKEKAPDVFVRLKAGTVTLPEATRIVKEKERPATAGTLLADIPAVPLPAVEQLVGEGVHTVEDLDARVAEIRKQRGRGTATRYEALRELCLPNDLVNGTGDALVDWQAARDRPAVEKPPVVATVRGGPDPLKPCPFCGSADVRISAGKWARVECQACFTMGPTRSAGSKSRSEASARAAWNKRAEPREKV
jgi:Lar family restriction alleviation protein